MNIFNIERSFKLKAERGWDTLYWLVDLHDTVFPGAYASDQNYEMYDGAVEVLKWISDRPDMKIIIWTSSFADHVDDVKKFFKDEHNITFDYYNNNPECGNTPYATFETKPYMNIGLDDKFGFEGVTDWKTIKLELIRIGEWK